MIDTDNKRQKTYKRLSRSKTDTSSKKTGISLTPSTLGKSLDDDREFFIEEFRIDVGPLLNQIHEQLADLSKLATEIHEYIQVTNQELDENKSKIADLKKAGKQT